MKNHMIAVFVLVMSLQASAQGPFKIINRTGTNADTERAFNEIEAQVNTELPEGDASTYAPGMANAAALSTKGIGSDYSNDLDFLMISVNLSAAVDSDQFKAYDFEDDSFDESTVNGVGVAASITLGMNMGTFFKKKWGLIDPKKLDVFINYLSFKKDDDGTDDNFNFKHSNFGIHARYHIHEGYSLFSKAILKWGGVFVTTGIERSSMDMNFIETYSETQTEGLATATVDGVGTVGIDSTITSIPIEVSTYIQAFYVLSLYTGLGIDLNFGDSDVTAKFNGNVAVSGAATGSGDAVLDLSGSGDVDSFTSRVFVGAQINIPVVKIYTQFTKQLGTDLSSVNLGVKFIW